MFQIDSHKFVSEKEVIEHLSKLSGRGPENARAVFYSYPVHTKMLYGGAQGEAFEGAKYAEGVYTIDQTEVGKFIQKLDSQNKPSQAFFDRLSREASRKCREGFTYLPSGRLPDIFNVLSVYMKKQEKSY